MTRVLFDISMSLDGFITGPNESIGNPLGDDGRLHDWMFANKTDADAKVLDEVYASQAEQTGLVFEQDLPSAPLFIRADASEIMRAIDNLVDNACKFTLPPRTVRVALSKQGGQAMISIADTGIGIPEDELSQLFKRNVEVQNAGEGKGSKFLIRLPVVSL